MLIDELNNLISEIQWNELTTDEEKTDTLLDILVMAYVFGNKDVCESLKTEKEPDTDKMRDSIYKEIAGKTWVDRVYEGDDLKRIADTESHRVFGDAQYDTAKDIGGQIYKKWNTMLDDKVRETHWYLEGLEIPYEEYFYTLAGERTLYPGAFGIASEDINCRCYLTYKKRGEA